MKTLFYSVRSMYKPVFSPICEFFCLVRVFSFIPCIWSIVIRQIHFIQMFITSIKKNSTSVLIFHSKVYESCLYKRYQLYRKQRFTDDTKVKRYELTSYEGRQNTQKERMQEGKCILKL